MSDTTIGGSSVGGSASAGGDFAGRDKYSTNEGGNQSRVEIHTDPQREPRYASGYTLIENVEDMRRALLGDPFNPSQPGILRSLAELAVSMNTLLAWRAAADIERANLNREVQAYHQKTTERLATTDSRMAALMTGVWVTAVGLVIEAVAIIWLLVERSFAG